MRKLSAITVILLLFCACILIGCTKGSEDVPPPSPIPNTTTPFPTAIQSLMPTISTTPPPGFTITGINIHSNTADGVTVFGLILNEMDHPASNIEIRIALFMDSTIQVAEQEFSLPIQHLQPGEAFPFSLQFPEVTQADQVQIKIVDFQRSGSTDVVLEVDFAGIRKTEDNKYVILGWISNPQTLSAQIHNIFLLFTDSEDNPVTFVIPDFHASALSPAQKVPFMALLDQDPGTQPITPFLDATGLQALDTVPFSFPQSANLTLDSQGNLLFRGTIRNDGSLSRWISCIVALQVQDQLVALSQFSPPIPLTAGENRAYGLSDFPGWKTQFQERDVVLDEMQASFYCDPLTSSEFMGQIFSLNAEVTGFETTGSGLIIRGEISNLTPHSLSNVVVQADLRTIDGTIQTSNLVLLEDNIEPDGTSSFILPIRLPQGAMLADLEIDVRAIALLLENVIPF